MESKLSPEQIEKRSACQTAEEASVFTEEESGELTDAILAQVAGEDKAPSMPPLFREKAVKNGTEPDVQWLEKKEGSRFTRQSRCKNAEIGS